MQFTRLAVLAGSSVLAFAQAGAASSSPLDTTIDLLAPATPCSGGACPADINLPVLSASPLGSMSFCYGAPSNTLPANPPTTCPDVGATLTAISSVTQLANVTLDNTNSATYPVVCDESPVTVGPVGFTTTFSNSGNGGGTLGYGAGGTNIVDLSSLSYSNPSGQRGVSLIFNNTPTKQVTCYPVLQIGAVAGGTSNPVLASNGTAAGDRVFAEGFENPLLAGASEPWISALTVGSLSDLSNQVVYVLQIHNASAATSGWFVDFGYDTTYFGSIGGQWCVIPPATAQPGNMPGTCIQNNMSTSPRYTVKSSDVHNTSINSGSADNTNSVYLKVTLTAPAPPSAPFTNWPTLPASFYPALGAIFPPAGVYPQRLDNKVTVASASNVPVQNIGSISCTNVATPVCTLMNPDGLAAPVIFTNTVNGSGTATIDPLVYFVDPNVVGNPNTTLPGNVSGDALSVNGQTAPVTVTCGDPQNILTSSANSVTISPSTHATGAQALGFTFAPGSGVPYQSGTATCTATFANSGYSPALTNIVTFSIEMQKAAVASIAMTSPTTGPVNQGNTIAYSLTVTNAGNASLSNIPVSDMLGSGLASVVWNTCTPIGSGVCPTLLPGNSQMIPGLPNNGDGVTFALTGTVGSITSPSLLQMVSNSASISPPSGVSCAGGLCATPAVTVPTVPIVGVSNTPATQTYSAGGNPYPVKVSNSGGTAVSGLSLGALYSPSGSALVVFSACTPGTGNSTSSSDGSSMTIASGDNVTCTATPVFTPAPPAASVTITSIVTYSGVCDSNCQAVETINP